MVYIHIASVNQTWQLTIPYQWRFLSRDNQLYTGDFPAAGVCVCVMGITWRSDEWGIGATQISWVVARRQTFQADVSSSSPETSAEIPWLDANETHPSRILKFHGSRSGVA